jgi:hypothetical protein
MKIRAIRLKEVGRFREAVALEGLSGGLDVLAGPNELGKTTILKAVKLALFEQHKSKAKKLEAFRPYAGGAPLIEVDFEIDGKPWRIRKQFLAAPAAELKDLRSGAVARGGDAETQLAELLSGAGRFALLWVDQGAPLAPVNPAVMAGGSLMTALEDEVESVADGGTARDVQAQVRDALALLVTSHNPPRPTGPYKQALDERDCLRTQREEALSRLARAEARLDRLQQLREEAARLSDPAAVSQRAEAAAAAAAAFEAARGARDKCRLAEEGVHTQEERLAALKGTLQGVDGQIADLAKLEDAARNDAPLLDELQARATDGEARAGEDRRRRDEIRAALAAAELERKALACAARLREVTERLAAARAAMAEHGSLTTALAANGADDGVIAAVRREAQSVATLAARLSAAAPAVRIAYARGGAGKVKVGGRVLADGETLNPTRPLAIEIEGVGVLTVAPGRSETLAEDEADLAARQTQLGELLARVGAASVDEAEQRSSERRDIEGSLSGAGTRLKTLAPDGLERLEQAHAELAALAGGSRATGDVRSQDELETSAHALMEDLAEAEERLAVAEGKRTQALVELERLRTRTGERRTRIVDLEASLGDTAARTAGRGKAAAAAADAEAARNRAVRDLAAWREAAPDDVRFAELAGAAAAAEGTRARAERALIELRRTEAGIEGELKSDRADDVESRVSELEEACAVVEARVSGLEDEIGALQLLKRELDAAAGETRDRFAKPVIDRLGPYLALVFADARARFGDGLVLDALQRSGTAEELGKLSDGTQEQLAVLVRLGFGRLLAETGTPAPLILDDALVYADDSRIERMFAALKLAAHSHQVLVLTCRERTFASLGGHRIAIGAWSPG